MKQNYDRLLYALFQVWHMYIFLKNYMTVSQKKDK